MTYSPPDQREVARSTLDDFYTGPELAQRWKVTLDTIRKWRATGYGPKGIRLGRHVRYPRESVEQWERARQP